MFRNKNTTQLWLGVGLRDRRFCRFLHKTLYYIKIHFNLVQSSGAKRACPHPTAPAPLWRQQVSTATTDPTDFVRLPFLQQCDIVKLTLTLLLLLFKMVCYCVGFNCNNRSSKNCGLSFHK